MYSYFKVKKITSFDFSGIKVINLSVINKSIYTVMLKIYKAMSGKLGFSWYFYKNFK